MWLQDVEGDVAHKARQDGTVYHGKPLCGEYLVTGGRPVDRAKVYRGEILACANCLALLGDYRRWP